MTDAGRQVQRRGERVVGPGCLGGRSAGQLGRGATDQCTVAAWVRLRAAGRRRRRGGSVTYSHKSSVCRMRISRQTAVQRPATADRTLSASPSAESNWFGARHRRRRGAGRAAAGRYVRTLCTLYHNSLNSSRAVVTIRFTSALRAREHDTRQPLALSTPLAPDSSSGTSAEGRRVGLHLAARRSRRHATSDSVAVSTTTRSAENINKQHVAAAPCPARSAAASGRRPAALCMIPTNGGWGRGSARGGGDGGSRSSARASPSAESASDRPWAPPPYLTHFALRLCCEYGDW